MICEVVSELEGFLKDGDFKKSIERMRSWLLTAAPGEPAQLLEACSQSMRPRITLLMRDLLSRYPSTVLGTPVMMYGVPDAGDEQSAGFTLPIAPGEIAKPCSDLHFLGWLPANAQLPVQLPFDPSRYDQFVPWRTPTVAIALFRSHPGAMDVEELCFPETWWNELFAQSPGDVRLEKPMTLSYPDALDVAAAMQAGARGEPGPSRGYFTPDVSFAHDIGIYFQECCRIQFQF